MAAYDLLIFDLDGTLVPTEQLATRVMGPVLYEHLGIAMTEQEITDRYRGRDLQTTYADLTELYGATLPQTFFDALNAAWIRIVEAELEPSTGAIEALEALEEVPRCIASNSTPEGISFSLRCAGLDAYFEHRYSCHEVENPKPAPDIYLHAARMMDSDPQRCLVIEDTCLGIEGAFAAGMKVVGYAGNAPEDEGALMSTGARVIRHFDELPALVLS